MKSKYDKESSVHNMSRKKLKLCVSSGSRVRLLLNIEQLLSEEVSVFEEVIFVKMPEMTAMVPNLASSLERPTAAPWTKLLH